MRIARLTDERLLHDLYAFRYRIYIDELAWLDPCSPPDSCACDVEALGRCFLTDSFDSVALNYAAFDEEGRVVGSIRVVPDGPLGLPLEECWHLNGFRSGRSIAELCRLAVTPERRHTRLPLMLMKAGWQGARRLGVSDVLVDAYIGSEQRTHAVYQRLGFAPLGDAYDDPRYVLMDPSLVMSIQCESGEEALPPRWRDFFRSNDPTIDHG